MGGSAGAKEIEEKRRLYASLKKSFLRMKRKRGCLPLVYVLHVPMLLPPLSSHTVFCSLYFCTACMNGFGHWAKSKLCFPVTLRFSSVFWRFSTPRASYCFLLVGKYTS